MSQLISGEQPRSKPAPRAWVMRKIIAGIQAGHYSVGQPLPSTRKLSQELSVNRGTISRAFTLLEEEGYLKVGDNGLRIVAARIQQPSRLFDKSIAVLITPPETWDERHREPGWLEYIDRGILDRIREGGLHAMSLNPTLIDEATITDLMHSRPRGIVVGEAATYSSRTISMVNAIRESGLPVVIYGDAPELAGFDRITSDHEAGAYQLTRWLLSKGCKRIVELFPEHNRKSYWAQGRARGCRRAMKEAGLPVLDPVLFPLVKQANDEENFNDTVRMLAGYLVKHLGPNRADAILCASDCFVFPVAAVFRLAGYIPNKDVIIAGYDNYWHETPERQFEDVEPAATVDKLNHVIGQEMVKLLLERISGSLPNEPQRRVVTPKMIVTER